MSKKIVMEISPEELANFISCELKMELIHFASNPKIQDLNSADKPYLIRKETTRFFDVRLNYINNWSKK